MKNTYSIKKNKVLKYILKKGIYNTQNYIVVHYTKNDINSNYNNFAVCVSKKNGNSVQRNKLKRWAREVYKNEEDKLKKGYNIIILYKKTTIIDNLNFNDIKNDIINCFKELKLYE